ncbi:MAG: ester cyclase [Bacteroidota bacterium]
MCLSCFYYLANDRIATRWEFVGKHTGNFFGVPATGKMVYFSGQNILQIKAGKISEIWHTEELLQCMAQINSQNQNNSNNENISNRCYWFTS